MSPTSRREGVAAVAAAALVIALGGVAPQPATAQAGERPAAARPGGSDFWRGVRDPGWSRSRTLLRHGLARAGRALQEWLRPGRAGRRNVELQFASFAMERFRLAHLRAPEDPEPLYLLARARTIWRDRDAPTSLTSEDERTIELLEKLRRIDPGYQAAHVAFDLGILYTRARQYRRAAAEYRRCLDAIIMPPRAPPTVKSPMELPWRAFYGPMSAATALYNLGDVRMMLGDVTGAVEHYDRAIEEARRSRSPLEFQTQVLATWGAAIAHDRLGEHTLALERAGEAIEADEEPMGVLHAEGVFFEPAFELYYYEALGHMALARRTNDEVRRREELREALACWQRFLEQGGDGSPWAEMAREHRRELEARLEDRAGRRGATEAP